MATKVLIIYYGVKENRQVDENMLEQDQILKDFVSCLKLLKASIDGLQGSQLDLSKEKDEWTIREIVHHLADGDYIWKLCVLRALGESRVAFHLKWYWETEQVRWSQLWGYASREIEPSLALLEANRNHAVELLRTMPGSLSKTIIIEWPGGDRQEVQIGWILEMQTNHVLGHIEDIREIREVHKF